MHGNHAICVRYTGLGAVVGVVECFARGGAKLSQDETLSGSVALNAVDGGITGLNDQQRLPSSECETEKDFADAGAFHTSLFFFGCVPSRKTSFRR